jgi:hypothetical protein
MTVSGNRTGGLGLAAGAVGLGMLSLASCAVAETDPDGAPSTPAHASTSPAHAPETRTPSPSASIYADGTYTADGEYPSPSGRETIGVTLTLVDDVVTEAIATPAATDPQARIFQKRFSMGISAAVVGRDIADLSVSRVSGSSLTSIGFNAAVEQIRAEALL